MSDTPDVSAASLEQSLDALGQSIEKAVEYRTDLEHMVIKLRAALQCCAHPTRGWPLVSIANAFEESRELVPDGAEGDGIAVEFPVDEAQRSAAAAWGHFDWRSMDSAPKDGTPILARLPVGDEDEEPIPNKPYMVVCAWSTNANGRFNWNDTEYTYAPVEWMPLP